VPTEYQALSGPTSRISPRVATGSAGAQAKRPALAKIERGASRGFIRRGEGWARRLANPELTGAPHNRPAKPTEAHVARPVQRVVRRQAFSVVPKLPSSSSRKECATDSTVRAIDLSKRTWG